MVANISVDADGNYEIASGSGMTPWHRLGVTVEDLMTSQECLELARLDWTVEKVPLHADVPVYEYTPTGRIKTKKNDEGILEPVISSWKSMPAPNTYMTMRRAKDGQDIRALSRAGKAVGRVYTPLQNHDAFTFMDELVQSQEAMFECAGALGQGEKVWMLAKLPHHINIGDDDRSDLFVLLTNSHDGTGSVKVLPTTVRVVCQNTLSMALSEANRNDEIFNIRHTGNMMNRVDEVREAFGWAVQWHQDFGQQAEDLLQVKMTKKQMDEYWIEVFDLTYSPEKDSAGEKHPNAGKLSPASKNRLKALNSMKKRKSNRVGQMNGTAWQALNVATEYVDHEARVIKSGKNQGKAKAQKDESAAFKAGRKTKENAHQILVETYL